jgi:hypothetical protein
MDILVFNIFVISPFISPLFPPVISPVTLTDENHYSMQGVKADTLTSIGGWRERYGRDRKNLSRCSSPYLQGLLRGDGRDERFLSKNYFPLSLTNNKSLLAKKICIMRSALSLLQRLQPTKRIVHYELFCPFLLEIQFFFLILQQKYYIWEPDKNT